MGLGFWLARGPLGFGWDVGLGRQRIKVLMAMIRDVTLVQQSSPLIINDGENSIFAMEDFGSCMEEPSVPVTLGEPSYPRPLGPKLIDLMDFQSMLG